jgi:Na+/serine symporter
MVKLVCNVIFNPEEAFEQIAKGKHLFAGFLLWFVSIMFDLLEAIYIPLKGRIRVSQDLRVNLGNIINILWVFILGYVSNIIAQKAFNYQNRYPELLACTLFFSVIYILDVKALLILTVLSRIRQYFILTMLSYYGHWLLALCP